LGHNDIDILTTENCNSSTTLPSWAALQKPRYSSRKTNYIHAHVDIRSASN